MSQYGTDPEWNKGWNAGHGEGFVDGYKKATAEWATQKSISISLLETHVAGLETRNFDLLKHNNELLARARSAEAQIPKVGWPSHVEDTLLFALK